MNYILNVDRVKNLSKAVGIPTIGELCAKANIHRNSITPYIKHRRSPFTQVILDIAKTLNVNAIELVTPDEDKELTKIKKMLSEVLNKEHAAFLFGSRARKSEKKFSDVDIGLSGGRTQINFSEFSKIKSRVEDAFDNFPLSLNLVNLDIAPLDFLFEIEPDLTFLYGSEKAAYFFHGYLNGRKKS